MYEHEGKGRKKSRALLTKAGYTVGGHVHHRHEDVAEDKKMIADAIHKHEKKQHPGQPLTKLKSGGKAKGEKPHHRLDKFARGGATRHKGGKTKINIVVGSPKDNSQADHMSGLMQGAALARAARGPQGGPPMPPIGAGGPPPGAMPPGGPMVPPPGAGPMPGMKSGGRAKSMGDREIGHYEYGAGSGMGREEKAENARKRSHRYADGGEVDVVPARDGNAIATLRKRKA